jgi:hypothetical protein
MTNTVFGLWSLVFGLWTLVFEVIARLRVTNDQSPKTKDQVHFLNLCNRWITIPRNPAQLPGQRTRLPALLGRAPERF